MLPLAVIQRSILPVFIAIYIALSLYNISLFFAGGAGIGIQSRPVAYRMLIPVITQVVSSLIPDTVEESITADLIALRDNHFAAKILQSRFQALPPQLSDQKIFSTSVELFIVYLTLLAFIWMLYVLTQALFPDSRAYALISPLVALLFIPTISSRYNYFYDFAELFFSCACFYLLFKQRWQLYILCLAIGTMNKETTIFSIFFYFIWFFNRLPRRQYINWGLLQLFIYALIKGAITLYYADRRGPFRSYFLNDQFFYVYHYGYHGLICMIITILVVTYQWQEKAPFLRGGLWMLFLNMIMYLFMCHSGEFRDLYWSMPVPILLGTHTLIRAAGIAHLPVFQPYRRQGVIT